MANVVKCKIVLPALVNSSTTASDGAPLTPGVSRSLSCRGASLSSLTQPRYSSAVLQSPQHPRHLNRVVTVRGKKCTGGDRAVQSCFNFLSCCMWAAGFFGIRDILKLLCLHFFAIIHVFSSSCHRFCIPARYDDDDVNVQNLSFFERLVKAWRILFPEKARKLR